MIADSAFFKYVKDFSVIKRDESDHFPSACMIKTSNASHHELQDEIISDLQPKKFKFDSSTAEEFAECQTMFRSGNVKISSQNCPELPSNHLL